MRVRERRICERKLSCTHRLRHLRPNRRSHPDAFGIGDKLR